MKKRILSVLLFVCMLSGLMVFMPTNTVEAESLITDEKLFMTYPAYLSNSEMDEGLSKATAAYYAVLNSYSDFDETVAALMTSMSDGISILIKEELANLGLGETFYNTQARKAATDYMQSMLTNENVIKKASGIVDKAYKTLKTSYSIASNIDKTTMMADLVKVATENDIAIKPDDIDELVDNLYDAGTLKKDLKAIGEANKLWKVVFELTEIHAIEKTTLNLLMDELSASGQTGSDLYLGLSLLKDDMEKNAFSYVLKYCLPDRAVSYLAKKADDLIGAATSANAVSLVTTVMKVVADYVYANAKAEDIIQATMQTSFISSIDICLSQYRTKFLQGTGTTEDIETYENLYAAYLSAYKSCLDSCYDVAKIDDKYTLGGDCKVWADEIEYTYTYDTYVRWCKEEVEHDIENATLNYTGSSAITDELNEETIKSRFERVYKLYPPNADKKFTGTYDGAKHSIGFCAKVFSMLFDKEMSNHVESKYNYILTSNKNVRLVGRLEEEEVTAAALKELFSTARIGDVVLTSGQYDYFQGMILTNVTDTGIEVYDCDSKYGAEKDNYSDLIQQYELTYEWMADAFSQNGKYHSKPGISIYRAIRKISSTSSDNALSNEEYDDSVNYVIENSVLTAYNGSRTTIEIPDGVTKIDDSCFYGKNIKYVYMPDTVEEIGLDAFALCSDLQYIDFSSSITKIDSRAFQYCSSLRNVILPHKLDYIGAYCFYKSGLISVNLPDSTRLIDWHCFEDCINLKTVTIGKGTCIIGEWAFAGCDYLNTIYWKAEPASSEYYDYEDAFVHCGSLSEQFKVVFAEGIKRIPDKAMHTGYNVTDIELPESLVSIGEEAFAHCWKLKSLTIPKNVSFIGADAINFCESLETIYWNAETVENFSHGGILTHVSSACKDLKVIFGNTVKSIPSYALQHCPQVNEIIIGENVEKIGSNAFSGCGVKELVIPNSVTTIEDNALPDLTNLIIPDSVTNLSPYGIAGDNLKNLTLPSSANYNHIIELGYCENLENIYISALSEHFQSVDGVLYGKDDSNTLEKVPGGRTTINILQKCNAIEPWAFSGVNKLQKITVDNGNTAFCLIDGVLYSYDKMQLIKYPPAKVATTLSVSKEVNRYNQHTMNLSPETSGHIHINYCFTRMLYKIQHCFKPIIS